MRTFGARRSPWPGTRPRSTKPVTSEPRSSMMVVTDRVDGDLVRRVSVLGDWLAEALEGDLARLRAAASAGVQAVDRGQLVIREREVEHVDVLCDSFTVGALH